MEGERQEREDGQIGATERETMPYFFSYLVSQDNIIRINRMTVQNARALHVGERYLSTVDFRKRKGLVTIAKPQRTHPALCASTRIHFDRPVMPMYVE